MKQQSNRYKTSNGILKTLLPMMLFMLLPFHVSAQKFALVDMEYILKNIPAYERANEQLTFTAGIDNLFDRNYAEHLSKGDANVLGYAVQETRVNELGRNFWLKAQYKF